MKNHNGSWQWDGTGIWSFPLRMTITRLFYRAYIVADDDIARNLSISNLNIDPVLLGTVRFVDHTAKPQGTRIISNLTPSFYSALVVHRSYRRSGPMMSLLGDKQYVYQIMFQQRDLMYPVNGKCNGDLNGIGIDGTGFHIFCNNPDNSRIGKTFTCMKSLAFITMNNGRNWTNPTEFVACISNHIL